MMGTSVATMTLVKPEGMAAAALSTSPSLPKNKSAPTTTALRHWRGVALRIRRPEMENQDRPRDQEANRGHGQVRDALPRRIARKVQFTQASTTPRLRLVAIPAPVSVATDDESPQRCNCHDCR
jgi:hypothetical protein